MTWPEELPTYVMLHISRCVMTRQIQWHLVHGSNSILSRVIDINVFVTCGDENIYDDEHLWFMKSYMMMTYDQYGRHRPAVALHSLLNCTWIVTRAGRVRELNWTNWTEELGRCVPNWIELNWQPTTSGSRTEMNEFFKNDFELKLRHSKNTPHPDQSSKHSQQSAPSLQPGDKPPGRMAGISARWDQELLICSSQTIGDSTDRIEPEPKRSSQVNPSQGRKNSWNEMNELNWTEALDHRARN